MKGFWVFIVLAVDWKVFSVIDKEQLQTAWNLTKKKALKFTFLFELLDRRKQLEFNSLMLWKYSPNWRKWNFNILWESIMIAKWGACQNKSSNSGTSIICTGCYSIKENYFEQNQMNWSYYGWKAISLRAW